MQEAFCKMRNQVIKKAINIEKREKYLKRSREPDVMNPPVHPTSLGLVGNWQLLVAFLLRLACRPLCPYAGRHPRARTPARSVTNDHSLSGTTPGGASPGLPSDNPSRPSASSPSQTTLDGILESGGTV
jgi:hypothetical protein